MEFQFQKDITGQPVAKCDLDCEAFGDWLSHDLSTDRAKIKLLLDTVDKLMTSQLSHYQYTGKIYHLIFENDEVELILNNSDISDDEFTEQLSEDQITGCGLVDFQKLLKEWQSFVF